MTDVEEQAPVEFYYDFEFLENGTTIEFISLGVVCSNGAEYYAISSDAPWRRIREHKWLRDNVLPNLPHRRPENFDLKGEKAREEWYRQNWELDTESDRVFPLWVIRNQLRTFFQNNLGGQSVASLWGYCSAYDHVRLMQIWGAMIDRPPYLPTFTNDVRQVCAELGVDDDMLTPEFLQAEGLLPECKHPLTAHNALHDAYHVKAMREFLQRVQKATSLDHTMESWQEGYGSALRARPMDDQKDTVGQLMKVLGAVIVSKGEYSHTVEAGELFSLRVDRRTLEEMEDGTLIVEQNEDGSFSMHFRAKSMEEPKEPDEEREVAVVDHTFLGDDSGDCVFVYNGHEKCGMAKEDHEQTDAEWAANNTKEDRS